MRTLFEDTVLRNLEKAAFCSVIDRNGFLTHEEQTGSVSDTLGYMFVDLWGRNGFPEEGNDVRQRQEVCLKRAGRKGGCGLGSDVCV